MSYENIFEKSYAKFTPDWLASPNKVDAYLEQNSDTILNFYKSYSEQFHYPKNSYEDLKVLDLGCGLGGVANFFAKKKAIVTGVDVSSLAITFAKEISKRKDQIVDYIQRNVCEDTSQIDEFDLIIDSHLLHCLTCDEQRKHYFEFVKNNLSDNGLFLLETMSYQNDFQTPVGYDFDESFVLWQNFQSEIIPIRKVMPSMDLENEVLDNGFKIHYLYYHSELSFDVFTDYKDYPLKYLPRTLRLAATKAKN